MHEKRKIYLEKFAAQLKEWNAQIVLIKAKTKNADADAKIEYQKTIEKLQNKQDKAEIRLHKLKESSDATWEALKTDSKKVWNDVLTTFHNVTSRFK